MNYGQTIREIREGRGVSQRKLAFMAGISSGYMSQIESGGRINLTIDVAMRLADALGVSLEEILKETPCRHFQIEWKGDVGKAVVCKRCGMEWWR